jgi:hypothetical protein
VQPAFVLERKAHRPWCCGFDGRLLAPEIGSFFGAGAADLGAVNDEIL